jgi:hypothetical protein
VPLAFVPVVAGPAVPPAVVLEVVLEVVPVFEFASASDVVPGPVGDVAQPHSRAVSKLI